MGEVEQSNVKVMVRCRPFNKREIGLEGGIENLKSIIIMDGPTVRVLDPERNYQEREAFEFDETFWSIPESQNQTMCEAPFAGQEEVFQKTGAPAVENALRGYHNTIFAYGQTGSGKTHSMLGIDADEGIAPRLIRRLFSAIEEEKIRRPADRVQYTVELSFLEIYNERVKDLLAIAERGQGRSNKGSTEYADCRVRFHPEKGTFVEGLIRLEISSEEECLHSIKHGMEHRAQAATNMNDTSSRSHAIFQICVSQKSPLLGTTRCSIINLVDLAGSERIKMSGVSGQALTEAKMINLSLSTLRRVIDVLIDNSKLKKGQRQSIPPYRESILTWVLSDSLGGNSKTSFVAAVSPYHGNVEDTMGTLRYALKAKAIVCNARVNEEKTAAVVNALRNEMEDLRRQLEAKHGADVAEQQRLQESLQERETEFKKMQEESQKLEEMKHQFEEELRVKADELAKAQSQMQALENVEEEKQKKEEELRRAREMQAQTAEMLKVQEDERKKKDDELEQVVQRKNSLKRHHDVAAEEEAKARLAAEQARRRQFISAFQNAFILGRQKSGLEELQKECADLDEKVKALEQSTKAKEAEHQRLQSDKALMVRKVEMLEKKCQGMQKELEETLRSKGERITTLTKEKAAADKELEAIKEDLAKRKKELDRLRDLNAAEQAKTDAKIDALESNHMQLKDEIDRKERKVEELKAHKKEHEEKLATLLRQAEEQQQVAAKLRAENREREDRLSVLQQRKSELERQRDAALTSLAQRRDQANQTRTAMQTLAQEAEELRRNHEDLRQYVSHKFFPTARPPDPQSARRHEDPNSRGNYSIPRSDGARTPSNTPRGRFSNNGSMSPVNGGGANVASGYGVAQSTPRSTSPGARSAEARSNSRSRSPSPQVHSRPWR